MGTASEYTLRQILDALADPASETTLADLLTELQLKADLTETQPVSAASLPLPSGAATAANQSTMITALQLVDDLRNALTSVGADTLDVVAASAGITAHTFFDKIVTASENSASFACEDYTECTLIVVVSAASGTTPTLVPEITISGDDTNWLHRCTVVDTDTQGSLTRLTAPTVEGKIQTTGTYGCLISGNLGAHMRVELTVGGTNPSFTLTAIGYFK